MYLTAIQGKSSLSPLCVGTSPTKSSPPLLASFCPLQNHRDISSYFFRLTIWPLHIHIRFQIAQQYPRSCLNVHSTSLIQVKIIFFFSVRPYLTGHALPIFLAAENFIAEVLDSTGTDFSLKLPSFQSPSFTMKESVFGTFLNWYLPKQP